MNTNSITEISVNDEETWNRTVRSFSDYDVFYLNGYAKAFYLENVLNGEPVLLYYKQGADQAVNVVFKRDVADDPRFSGKIEYGCYIDLITPYGYGGFWGDVTDWPLLNRSYNQYCTENHFLCEFVRFELFTQYARCYDGKTESRSHNVVRNLEIPLDEIWMDFKPKVRKNVKRANGYGLKFAVDLEGRYLEDFLRIYYSTMDRSGAQDEFYFSRDFFRRLEKLRGNAAWFYALYNGNVVSSELMIYGSEHAYSYLGGTDRKYFDLRPNDFLKYEMIKWCKEKGLKDFVLGGGYGADDGIYQYKQCLAPHGIMDFYIGHKVFDEKRYEELVKIREKESPGIRNSTYFPVYRAD